MKVSVIIRTFNNITTLKRAINSALNQDYLKNMYEIIIIDDKSKDGTINLLKQFEDKEGIKIIYQKHSGSHEAANKGINFSKGDYIVFLDGDDYFLPDLIKKLSSILDRKPNLDFVYPDYIEKLKTEKKVISPHNIFETIACGILFHRKFLIKSGLYNKNIFFAEYDLLLKMSHRLSAFHYKEPLYVYCRRENSMTGNQLWVNKAISQLKKIYPQKHSLIKKIRSYTLNKSLL